MRWGKGPRAILLKGIFKNRRGALFEKPEGPGYGERIRYAGEHAQRIGIGLVLKVLLILVLLVGGFYLYGLARSDRGALIAEQTKGVFQNLGEIFSPVLDVLSFSYLSGADDYFGTTTVSGSEKQGIDIQGLRSVSGSTIPAGTPFDIEFLLNYNDATEDPVQASFECSLLINEETEYPGTIYPQNPLSLRKGQSVYCRIPGEATAGLDQTATVYGSFSFEETTENVEAPVYFISKSIAEQVGGQENFFEAYGIQETASSLRPSYHGEPLGMGIGIAGSGQPVLVDTNAAETFAEIGITLENHWNGEVLAIKEMHLYLPDGVSLDTERYGGVTATCPFVEGGRDTDGRTIYQLDSSLKESFFSRFDIFGSLGETSSYQSFRCWIVVEESIVRSGAYAKHSIGGDVAYTYKTIEARESIILKNIQGAQV